MRLITFALMTLFLAGCGVQKSKFEDVGYWKKDKARVFSVYATNLDFDAMEKFAKRKMWSENGATTVYFFNNRSKTPDVTLLENPYEWEKKYDPFWVAAYWHDATGKERFEKYPKS